MSVAYSTSPDVCADPYFRFVALRCNATRAGDGTHASVLLQHPNRATHSSGCQQSRPRASVSHTSSRNARYATYLLTYLLIAVGDCVRVNEVSRRWLADWLAGCVRQSMPVLCCQSRTLLATRSAISLLALVSASCMNAASLNQLLVACHTCTDSIHGLDRRTGTAGCAHVRSRAETTTGNRHSY